MLERAAYPAVCFEERKETTRENRKESYVMKWIDVVAAACCDPALSLFSQRGGGCRLTTLIVNTAQTIGDTGRPHV